MKLVDLYIDGFGALTGYPLSFKDGLTCVLEENGFGKTTLTAFIKAMFYSLPTAKRGQSADKNDRIKYLPWNSNLFGGRLTFEVSGRTYTVIRNFDSQSATRDSFQLIDTVSGKPSCDFSEKLGEELFGVDENGFFRSTFSNGTPDLTALPSSVRVKISGEMGISENIGEFETAQNILVKLIKSIGGKNGSLEKTAQKISEDRLALETCQMNLKEYERTVSELEALEIEQSSLLKQKREIESSLSQALGAEASKIKLENYDKLTNEITALKNRLSEIEKNYGGKCPDEEYIERIHTLLEDIKANRTLYDSEKSKMQSEAFASAFEKFSKNMPSDEQMQDIFANSRNVYICEQKIAELKAQITSLDKSLSAQHIENLSDLSEKELNDISLRAARASSARNLSTNPAQKTNPLPFILSALIVATGIGLLFINTIVGVLVAAVGAVALIALGLLAAVKKTVGASQVAPSLTDEDKKFIKSFLVKYGFSPDADVNSAIEKLKSALDIITKIEQNEDAVKLEQEAYEVAKNSVSAVLEEYQIEPVNLTFGYEKLKSQRDYYLNIVLPAVENIDRLKSQIISLENEVKKLLSDISVDCRNSAEFEENLERIRNDASEYKNGIAALKEKIRDAEESFKRDNISEISLSQNLGSIDELKDKKQVIDQKFNEITNDIAALKAKSARFESYREEINTLSDEIETAYEVEKEEKQKLILVEKTYEFLTSAKTAMTEKYAGSLEQNFKKYSEKFLCEKNEVVSVDSALELSVKKDGIARGPESFSSGQQSVMDVCLRLSLVDAMFEKEKPFVILDDPFSLMDEQNLGDALSLLKETAEDRQIIYLTCHPSREIR